MKSKKGFTLIELLAVLVILALLIAIAIPTITSIISDSKNNLSKDQQKVVIDAARMWYLDSDVDLENNQYCDISISNIIDDGYVEGSEVIDPKTGDSMTGYIRIKNNGEQYSYNYYSTSTVSPCE